MRTPINNCLVFIKTIFDAIKAMNDAMIENDSIKSTVYYLNLIESQLQLTLSFVNDLLDLRCIKDGVFTLVSERFDPCETFSLVKNIFKRQAEVKGIDLSWEIVNKLPNLLSHQDTDENSDSAQTSYISSDFDTLPQLLGDKRRLLQVLINLVKNALKFTYHGHITIKSLYCREKESLIVHVQDSGVGIAQTEMPRLFERFGKMQRTAAINSDGIGLGLLIVK